jgi:hypothetical protein
MMFSAVREVEPRFSIQWTGSARIMFLSRASVRRYLNEDAVSAICL